MSRADAYAEAAIRGALEDLRASAEGGRNDATYATAARLGAFVAAGVLDVVSAEGLLLEASLATGLPREEALPTLRRGLTAGQTTPAALPADGDPAPAPRSPPRRLPIPTTLGRIPTARETMQQQLNALSAEPAGDPLLTLGPPAVVAGLEGWRLQGTRLRSRHDRHGTPFVATWDGLLEEFARPLALADLAAKNALPAWTAGVYSGAGGPHSLEGGVKLDKASAVVLDLDTTQTPPPKGAREELLLNHARKRGERLPRERLARVLAAVLPGAAWAAHPTASSTPAAWRWRLVLPLAEELPGFAYTTVVDALRFHFLGSEAPLALEADATHNRKPEGLSYCPATTAEARKDYEVLSAEGGLLSWRSLLEGLGAALGVKGTSSSPEFITELGTLLPRRCEDAAKVAAKAAAVRLARLASVEALGFVRPAPAWFSEEPPPREYLLHLPSVVHGGGRGEGLLARGVPGILSAGGGTGKTYALVGLALAIVTRTPWLGRYPVGAATIGRCALLLGEEPLEEVRRRLYAQARALGLSLAGLEDRLLLLPGSGAGDLALTQSQDGGQTAQTEFAGDLFEYLTEEAGAGWDAILVDPLSHFAGPDTEKDNAAASRLMQTLARFTKLPGSPVVLMAHHERKPGNNDGTEASSATVRGSSAIVDNARWVARLATEKEAKVPPSIEAYGLVRFTVTKSNYAPPEASRGDLLLRVKGGALRAATGAEREAIEGASEPRLEDMRPGTPTISERHKAREAKTNQWYDLARIKVKDNPDKLERLSEELEVKRAKDAEAHSRDKLNAEQRRKR